MKIGKKVHQRERTENVKITISDYGIREIAEYHYYQMTP
jgi:hypothetical protein